MSYNSRRKCDARHIIGCGLCSQVFNCPYDEEAERVVFTKEHRKMIKPEDLRIGDIVIVNKIGCAIPKNAICKVVGIDSERIFEEKNLRGCVTLIKLETQDYNIPYGIWCNYIDPIPLTLELLKKNNFKEEQHQKEGTSEWYDYYHYDLGINIVYEVEENKFVACLDGKKLKEIKHVHELQHILWALGLNAELKV